MGLFVIGSSNTDLVIYLDHIPKIGETVIGGESSVIFGGKGANQAVAAKRAGADAIKFQSFKADSLILKDVEMPKYQKSALKSDKSDLKNYEVSFQNYITKTIYNLSIKDKKKLEVTVGCDQKDKIDPQHEISLTDDLSKFSDLFDVVIDFSLPEPSISTIQKCVAIKKPITIGTTGFNKTQLEHINKASKQVPILLAPNMSHGVNVSLKSLALISKNLRGYDVLIKEVHHVNKVDSPSGTAIKMAHVICDNQNIELGDINSSECPIKFESLRQDTEIGTHEVIFKNKSDEIRLIHIAKDRSIFADGALETAMWVKNQKAGLYTYNDYMVSK